MGGFNLGGSESESTTINETPNAAVQTGQAPGVAVNSKGDVNVKITDEGAVSASLTALGEVAGSIGTEAIRGNTDVALGTVDSMRYTARDAFNLISNVVDAAGRAVVNTVNTALDNSLQSERNVTDIAGKAIATSEYFGELAYKNSQSVLDLSEELNYRTNDALKYTVDTVASYGKSVTSSLLTTVEDLDESRALQSKQTIDAVSDLATVVQTGGESIQSNINKAVMIISVLVVGLVAWRAVSK